MYGGSKGSDPLSNENNKTPENVDNFENFSFKNLASLEDITRELANSTI